PVLVAQPVTNGRDLHGGHGVEEARGESAETAIAKAGVGFLLNQLQPVDALLASRMLNEGIQHQVGDVVAQRAPNQKFHGEVVDALYVLLFVGGLGLHPALRQDVADGARESLKALAGRGDPGVDHAIKNQPPLVKSAFRTYQWNGPASVLLKQ